MSQQQSNLLIRNQQSMKVSSLTLDKDGLHNFCRLLQERANTAGDMEAANYQKGSLTDDQYTLNKQTLKEGFLLRTAVAGKNGENLWGNIEDVFSSPNFPEEVMSLLIDSQSPLKASHNYYARNSFVIFLDFTKPKVLDFTFLPSQETPNESNLKVQGYDATWVNGVFAEIKKFIDERYSSLSIVHGHSFYDVLLWFLGFPITFWVCYKLSPAVESAFANYSNFLVNALYLYVFVATLFLFRFLFHYLRWVCPLVEYRAKNSRVVAHRLLLSAIAISVLGSFIYDVIKLLNS